MKYAPYFGILFALLLVFCCFQPWAWYPDINEVFTGFYSKDNTYGRPGRTLIFFSILAILFFIVPKFWARRANLMVGVLTVVFAVKAYVLFSACYHGFCPEKKPALFGILGCALGVLVSALLSGTNMPAEKK